MSLKSDKLPSTHRLFCMLKAARRVLEKVIRNSLADAICAAGDLLSLGFRAERSTVNVVMEVVDVIYRTEAYSC